MEADGPGVVNRLRELLAGLSAFERRVVEAAVVRLLREEEDPARRRRRAQELERRRLINSGAHPRDAAELARGGRDRTPWIWDRSAREKRAARQGLRW